MSGRSRHLRDGKWITNRKTDRRQSVAVTGSFELSFLLPDALAFAIAPGPGQGWGVVIEDGGLVKIVGNSVQHACRLAAAFLDRVAPAIDLILKASLKRLPEGGTAPPIARQMADTWNSLGDSAQGVVERLEAIGRPCTITIMDEFIMFRGAVRLDVERKPL